MTCELAEPFMIVEQRAGNIGLAGEARLASLAHHTVGLEGLRALAGLAAKGAHQGATLAVPEPGGSTVPILSGGECGGLRTRHHRVHQGQE